MKHKPNLEQGVDSINKLGASSLLAQTEYSLIGQDKEVLENYLAVAGDYRHIGQVALRIPPAINTDDFLFVCGVDEVGRGPWAGPVVATALILKPHTYKNYRYDSKQLSPRQREEHLPQIEADAICYHIAEASAREIDQINILNASMLAMRRAVAGLTHPPGHVWVDGLHAPRLDTDCPVQAIVRGDVQIPVIRAASILAKVARDRIMQDLDQQYPLYGFAQHKGYGTQQHQQNLQKYGPCPYHRRSFAPVRAILYGEDKPKGRI